MACMNVSCGASNSIEWKKGWPLRSGGYANLCDKCGSAYEQFIFCDIFHAKESGWRECTLCGKRLHCGCVASRFLLELLDGGGVKCINCAKNSGLRSITNDEKPNGPGTSKVSDLQLGSANNQLDGSFEQIKVMQLANDTQGNGLRDLLQSQKDDSNGLFRKMKQEEVPQSVSEIRSTCLSNLNQASNGSSEASKAELCKANIGTNDIYESLPHTNLSMTLGTPLGNLNPFPGAIVDERENSKASPPFLQGARSRHLLPKPPKSALATGLEANTSMASQGQIRVARPPAEGRGRNQLLPRYWPRITDQELQQISGDSNSTIVPLFEKMLSASDAGRIGRLVLPKACAEAYFPAISQPEGLPLKIQDVKGKEWVFQFRFWPNNNSRMYVLEGVTPCIQSMQLQAGDTVTFSRMDPEGKLIMGFRKASNSVAMQDTHPSAIHNGGHSSETFFSGVFENLPIISGYSGLLQSLKGSADTPLNPLSKHLTSACADITWHKSEKHEGRTREGLLLPSLLVPEKKRARNIGSKSKRLHIDSHDALELKLTWEEAQDLLRPPPAVKPSTVVIEDHEFEEYEEPPVFGKRSIFTVRSSGEQEQWVQCDGCFKWRRLPVDVLLPSKWTCVDNAWDQSRCSCSAPDELSSRELESLLRMNKEFKKRRTAATNQRLSQEHESSGLDALANAAILGDNAADPGTTSVATTTKHPRHRPGCSCIVCIQPPSGKGKHKPTCTCNVCMTVKRRFNTLMMNKKKRQSEREAEIAQRNQQAWASRDEAEVESSSRHVSSQLDPSDNEAKSANELESKSQSKSAETAKEKLDLNSHPGREEDLQAGSSRVSMMSLLQVASRPLDTYLKQNGLTSLIQEQQTSSATHALPQVTTESEGQRNEDPCCASGVQERESGDEEQCETDQNQSDPL
ncbi:B3 domain-containing transcription repressor VAL2 isoform X1 [Ziziphus jujuba]|uniref:B3 domain-containing transcription repressor VAL2 isoform X1 n=1 Tax=Ziziphus jujuba TaxID=326968 RepID=A0A6P4B5Y2_ZIZJJ|nr:B3 domain-containing transcription repressor VAL2 isoform X1 [Ziziphus jujuba]XP_015897449.3 B3 domain-containing transcription repressor VAL2 isoform X1 [Ziziphus jujuba]